jgi:diguanylate cyclase (GGDEF)-like protein
MSESHFAQLAITEVFANSNQVIGIVDPDMVVRWLSPSAASHGLDAVGRSIVDLIHPDDLERAAHAFDGTALQDGFEPSQMANSIVTLRLVTNDRVVPFDASGRWVVDANGNSWLIAVLNDITTRHATDLALRQLAAGSNERDSMRAIISAVREYGGVKGAQMVWHSARGTKTFGDLGEDPAPVLARWGDLSHVRLPGLPIDMADNDWGYVLPVIAGRERLGSLATWGVGSAPELSFVAAAMSPLLDLTALSLKRARELADLERRATTDQVTGLVNRHAFFAHLDCLVEGAAMMYIDLDGFKEVNDEYGHTLGDRLLGVVSRRISDAVGDDDVVGRIGGDEFAVLVRTTGASHARQIGQRIVDALNQTFVIDGHRIVTGASVGIALTDVPTDGRMLLDSADQALLEAKAQGKGRAVVLATY